MKLFKPWRRDALAEKAPSPDVAEVDEAAAGAPRSRYPKKPADISASIAATERFKQRCADKLASYVPTGPAFRIVQRPAGHFEIERRRVESAVKSAFLYYDLYSYDVSYEWADVIDAYADEPREYYEVVKNTDAPIKTMDHGYGYGYRFERHERLVGYAPLAFNIFAEAEAYLQRMAEPAANVTEYDFPPLKKRAKRTRKATEPS